MKTTVILGGGMGGIATARALREAVGRDHRVVVIDRSEAFVVGAALEWVTFGEWSEGDATGSREKLAGHGIEFVRAEISEIDPERRRVQTTAGSFEADFLVVALGADLNLAAVPGLADSAETFYTLGGAARLRQRLQSFTSGEIVVLIPRIPFKCPPAPYEAAILLHDLFSRRGRRDQVRISVHTVEPAPMPTAGPGMGKFLRDALAAAGIGYHPLRKTERVDSELRVVRFEGGQEAAFDLLVAVPPHQAPAAIARSPLAGEGGWIPADPRTLATRFADVWAIGDVSALPLPGRFAPDKPLVMPKAGIFAERQGRAVAAQIAARVGGGSRAPAEFDGTGFCYIETGEGRAARGDGAFYATPAPEVAATPPDTRLLEEKRRWVRGWLALEP